MEFIIVCYNWWQSTQTTEFSICFHYQDRRTAITDIPIDVILFDEDQKSYHKTDSTGCFKGKSNSQKISLIAQSPYHKTIRFKSILIKKYPTYNILKPITMHSCWITILMVK